MPSERRGIFNYPITELPNSPMSYNPCMLGLATTGSVGAAAAVAAGYQSMAPTGQWDGQTFVGLGRGSHQIARTYHGGPNEPHTPPSRAIVAKHEPRATFH